MAKEEYFDYHYYSTTIAKRGGRGRGRKECRQRRGEEHPYWGEV